MSIGIVTTDGVTNDATGTVLTTGGVNSAGANLVVVAVEWGDNAGTTTCAITDSKSNSPYTDCGAGAAQLNGRFQMFYCTPTSVGAGHTITATISATKPFRRIMVWFLSGADATTPLDSTGKKSTATGTAITTAAITPSQSDNIIIFAFSNNDGATTVFTANNGFALDFGVSGTLGGTITFDTDGAHKTGATGAQTPSATATVSSDWRAQAACFKAAIVAAALLGPIGAEYHWLGGDD